MERTKVQKLVIPAAGLGTRFLPLAQTRSFCYVTDQVTGLLKLLTADSVKGEIVNMGNNEETTILGLSKLIIKLTGSESDLKFEALPEDDPARRLPDIAEAKRLIGYAP